LVLRSCVVGTRDGRMAAMFRWTAALLVLVPALVRGGDDASERSATPAPRSIAVSVSGPATAPIINVRTAEDTAWSVPLVDAVRDGSATVSRSAEDPSYTIVTILADAPPAPVRAQRSASSARPASEPQRASGARPAG
jgi:hypothetical protein